MEEGGNKWSKPHVATLSLHSLFELRSCIMKGTVLLDLEASDLGQIAGGSWDRYMVGTTIHWIYKLSKCLWPPPDLDLWFTVCYLVRQRALVRNV